MSLWSAAVSSAEQLAALATGEDVDAQAHADADAFVAELQDESRAAHAESERRERDRTMLARLEGARIPADDDVRNIAIRELRRLDAAYSAAFAEYLGATSLPSQSSQATLT